MNNYVITKNNITFNFKYDSSIIDAIKLMFDGRRFDPTAKVWTAPNTPQNKVHLSTLERLYDFTEEKEIEYDIEDLKEISLVDVGYIDAIKEVLTGMNLKMTPRHYQMEGIASMVKTKRTLNGDDMGLGKTAQALLAVEVGDLFPVLIVTPASVKYNWKKEWNKWIDNRSISIIDKKELDFTADVVIINYELLVKHKKKLDKVGFYSMIVDESQYVKNSKSQRSKAVRSLSKKVEYLYLLSGTAIMNRPIELTHALKLLGVYDTVFGGWNNFIHRYCDATQTPFGLDTNGASNTLELNKLLRENCYIRREIGDVLSELPERTEQFFEVPFKGKTAFKKASNNIIDYILKIKGKEAAERAEEAPHLIMANELKDITINGKLDSIKQWIKDYKESTDGKLLVFGRRTAPLKLLSDEFDSDLINGSVSSEKKLKLVEKFQTSDDQILFGNILSLGTGVDGLQDVCHNVLFIELPDRPSDLEQAIARLHRSGQRNPVNVYHIFAKDSVDQIMWEVLRKKYEVTDAVNKGRKINRIGDMSNEIYKKMKKNK